MSVMYMYSVDACVCVHAANVHTCVHLQFVHVLYTCFNK